MKKPKNSDGVVRGMRLRWVLLPLVLVSGCGQGTTVPTITQPQDSSTSLGATTSTTTTVALTETMGQSNARKKAQSYLDIMPFSRTGLITQLEFEGYSTSDATYGVDAFNVNWNEQAKKKAQSYLDIMPFSRTGLITQLKFEGYSTSEAEYGVTAVGL